MTEDALRRLMATAAGDEPGAPDANHLMGTGRRRKRARRLITLGTTAAVALGIAVPLELGHASSSTSRPGLRLAADLTAFSGCDTLLQTLKDRTRPTVGAYGYLGGNQVVESADSYALQGTLHPAAGLADSAKTAPTAASAQTQLSTPLDHSSTTDRTRGVDEPDLVKSDGVHVFVLQHSTLSIYDARDPKLVGSIVLSKDDVQGQDMLLEGSHVVVLGGQPDVRRSTAKHETSVLRVVDVSDAAHPAVTRTLTVDGTVLDARLQGGQTRLVLQISPPQLSWFQATGGASSQTEATDSNRRLLDATTIDDWLPTYGLVDASGKDLAHGTLLSCDRVTEPTAPGTTGTDLVGVVTLDPTASTGPQGEVAVIGAGNTVYASGSHLWLATGNEGGWGEPWCFRCYSQPQPGAATTQLHGFDLSDPTAPTYLASAALDGTLHDDSAVDEADDGTLRVVTTQADGTRLDVLHRDGQVMTKVGSVTGLGPGETVQSVRWLGDLAYVVTFRQTDPLRVIDLSDAAHPRARGTLKVPGFSSYLFSPEKGRLVGTGPGSNGTTVEQLFDISDPDAPAQLSVLDLHAWRDDESTHALLFWKPSDLLFLPVGDHVSVTHVSTSALAATYELTHAQRAGSGDSTVQRVSVVGPRIWTVSARGVLVSLLAAGKDVAWLPFG